MKRLTRKLSNVVHKFKERVSNTDDNEGDYEDDAVAQTYAYMYSSTPYHIPSQEILAEGSNNRAASNEAQRLEQGLRELQEFREIQAILEEDAKFDAARKENDLDAERLRRRRLESEQRESREIQQALEENAKAEAARKKQAFDADRWEAERQARMVRARMAAQRERKAQKEEAEKKDRAAPEGLREEEADREKRRVFVEQQRVELVKWKEAHQEAQRKAAQAQKDKAEAEAKALRLAAQKQKDKAIAEAKALEAAEQKKSDQEAEKAAQLAAIQARIKRAAAHERAKNIAELRKSEEAKKDEAERRGRERVERQKQEKARKEKEICDALEAKNALEAPIGDMSRTVVLAMVPNYKKKEIDELTALARAVEEAEEAERRREKERKR